MPFQQIKSDSSKFVIAIKKNSEAKITLPQINLINNIH